MLIECISQWKPAPHHREEPNRISMESMDYRNGMSCAQEEGRRQRTMLFTIAVILLVLWLLGLVSGYTMGNFIYVLLVIALVLFVVGLVSGRRTV
jgi:hypothetical protein